MAIPYPVLEEFAVKWKKEIGLPFSVLGLIPVYVKREKLELLIWAGMNRVRMGIQSGSDRILKFYNRPNKPGVIKKSTSIIGDFKDYMIPPAYDIILDNPIETRQDVIDTLELIYEMPRPFTLNIFALRVIPNTKLADDLEKANFNIPDIRTNYLHTTPTLANTMVHLLTFFKPPRWIFEKTLKGAKPFTEKQRMYPISHFLFRLLFLSKRAFDHLRYMDFSVLPGKIGFLFWKIGLIQFWYKYILKKPPKEKPSKTLDLSKHKV
jgi:radical SAM superfamily enzyme YgiQ (UPF0313 family)